MHDDLLERRLRGALHDEAASLPFTITAAELERRYVGGRRVAGNRRHSLLLAAAVAIGALGAGALIGALSDHNPSPTTPITAVQPTPADSEQPSPAPRSAELPRNLPSLGELIAGDDSDVLVAQAQGPADDPGNPVPTIDGNVLRLRSLGEVTGDGTYRITAACLGTTPIEVRLADPSHPSPGGQSVACDGSVVQWVESGRGMTTVVGVYHRAPASWRVVVRGTHHPLPLPTANPILPPSNEGIQELARVDNRMIGSDGLPWADEQMLVQEIGEAPGRQTYGARIWCEPGHSIRIVLGDRFDGIILPSVETHLLCDGLVHQLEFDLQPDGARLFVASQPDARWSIVLESARPPVALTQEEPGWQLSTGFGPELSFDAQAHRFTGVGVEGGGPVRIVLACAGPQAEVYVEAETAPAQAVETQGFLASCSPDGATTAATIDGLDAVTVAYTAPPGSWTALSILVPDPLPQR